MNLYKAVALILSTFFLFTISLAAAAAPTKEELLDKLLLKSLSTWHYSPQKIDDAFSKKAFTLYLKRLDPQKRFLIQADVDSLKKFETSFDDDFREGDFNAQGFAQKRLRMRILETQSFVQEMLKTPFQYSKPDSLQLDAQKESFAVTQDALKLRWEKILRYQTLLRIREVQEDQNKQQKLKTEAQKKEKSKDKETVTVKPKSFDQLEDEARKLVGRNVKRLFDRMLREENLEQAASYLNTLSNVYDPHTEYFKPEAKEEFELSMTGTLEGIGAVLREDDGYIKVVSIVPGSAAWRQKELKAEDKILKVAQGSEEPVDVVEASVNEAVKMIRGKKGTEVRLSVQKPSGQITIIPIIRDIVIVEDTYAKSAVIESEKNHKHFGYIDLPAFYHDFNNSKGRNATDDIRKELVKLKAEKVDGIILDLRNNGGGALEDAVKMAGLFIRSGPIVQVRDQKGNGQVLSDVDTSITFGGPLVVMVNSFSASASEIVAAALQDYGRATIVGTDTSFGKGTVQSMMDLDNYVPPAFASMRPLGSLKLTIQKFYRINGGSTQYKGVVPEILMPDAYSHMEIGERNLEYALPWDTVSALRYEKWNKKIDLAGLKLKYDRRFKTDPTYGSLKNFLSQIEKQKAKTIVSLKKEDFQKDQLEITKQNEKFEEWLKSKKPLAVKSLEKNNGLTLGDSVEIEKNKKWTEGLGKDLYLHESVNVIDDM